jgi:TonB-linked SusC/RagA family outer membrane protein
MDFIVKKLLCNMPCLKLSFLFLLLHLNFQVIEAQSIAKKTVDINVKNVSLGTVISSIEKQTESLFVYDKLVVDIDRIVTLNVKEALVSDVLQTLFAKTDISFTFEGKNIILKKKSNNKIQEKPNNSKRKITGLVTDEKGESIIGASITGKNTKIGTISDINGNFTLDLEDESVLKISYIGYRTTELKLEETNTVTIKLIEEVRNLDEIVVIGYGTQKKASLVGSISTVGSADILKSPTGDVTTALSGRLPGLATVQQSGQPGGALPIIRIRGQEGVLVIVDGVERQSGGRVGSDASTNGVTGSVSGWEAMNPEDIESVSILKDASATAVYGVRGANGVIIITTKKGLSGKPKVTYSGNFSLSRPIKLRNSVNSTDYIAYNREGNYNDGQPSTGEYSYERYLKFRDNYNPILYPSLNMNEYLLKDSSPKQTHNVNVRGGTDVVKYFTSIGYYDEDGLIKKLSFPFDPNQHYDRLSLRTNLDFQFTKRFSMSIYSDVRFENRRGTASTTTGNSTATDLRFFQFLHTAKPWITPGFNEDGKYIQTEVPETTSPQMLEVMLAGGMYTLRQITSNNLITFKHDLDFITEGLSVQAKYSLDSYTFNNGRRYPSSGVFEYYRPVELPSVDNPDKTEVVLQKMESGASLGYAQINNGKSQKQYFEAALNYQRTFGDHAVTGLLLFNQDKISYNVGEPASIPRAYLGYVTRVTYNFKNKYLAEFNMGINGSENFPKGKRFGVFPAYSLGWVVTEEPFMKSMEKVMSFLKIRGSYGLVGDDSGGGRFIYIDGVYNYFPRTNNVATNRFGYYGNFGDQTRTFITAIQEGSVANEDVTWAKAAKKNIGFDAKFFRNKMDVSFDYFDEKRTDIITTLQNMPNYLFPTPANGEFSTFPFRVPANYNETATNGYEVTIGWQDKIGKHFSYYLNGSYSYAVTLLTKISEPKYDYPWMYNQGQYAGQIRGLIADGYWSSYEEINNPSNPYNTYGNNPIPGDIKYKDVNGDMQIDANDQVMLGFGNTQPVKTFSFDTGFAYKGFELSALFQGTTGVMFAPSQSSQILMGNGNSIYDWISDRWTPSNRNGTYPVLHAANASVPSAPNFQPSSYWAYDATYVRLKNIQIAYNLPKKMIKFLNVSNIKLSISGQNLLAWTPDKRMDNYDPEQISSGRVLYPIMSIYNVGLNVAF